MSKWLNQKQLCELWGKSRQTAGHWMNRQGCPKRERNGRTEYQWPEFVEWWASERERIAREQRAPPEDFEQARARKMAAEAELAEHELAVQRAQLVTTEDFRASIGVLLDGIRAGMLAIPAKWAPLMVGLRNVPEAQLALEPLVAQALTEWTGTGGDH